MKNVKILLVIAIFLISAYHQKADAATCQVTNTSGENKPGSLLRALKNQIGGGGTDECDSIQITVSSISPLVAPARLLKGNTINGNNVTLSLDSNANGKCVVEVYSTQGVAAGAGGSTLNDLKVSGGNISNGICVYSNDNEFNNITVSNTNIGLLALSNDNIIKPGNKFYNNTTGIEVMGGLRNFITQSSFYQNDDIAIQLSSGGNSGLMYPSGTKVVATKATGTIVGITGLADPHNKTLEFF